MESISILKIFSGNRKIFTFVLLAIVFSFLPVYSFGKDFSPPITLFSEKNNSGLGERALNAYETGYKHYRAGRFKEAEKSFNEALQIEPNLIKAHYWLGKLYREMGMLKESVFHEEEVLRLINLIRERRIALSVEDNEYPALEQIQKSRDRETKAAEAFFRGKNLLSEGHWDGAISEFKTAVEFYPANREYVLMLARILWDRGDFQGSAKFYSSLLEMENLSKDLIIEGLDRLILSRNRERAYRFLKKIVSENPAEEEFKKRLASIEEKIKLPPASIGKVLRRLKAQAVLDFGQDRGLKLSDEYSLRLRAFCPGEPILDPASGKEIGRLPDTVCGNLLVTKVFSNSCWALIQEEFGQGIKVGDLVEIKSPQR